MPCAVVMRKGSCLPGRVVRMVLYACGHRLTVLDLTCMVSCGHVGVQFCCVKGSKLTGHNQEDMSTQQQQRQGNVAHQQSNIANSIETPMVAYRRA